MIAKIIKDEDGNPCIEFTEEQCKELGITDGCEIEWEVDGTDIIMRVVNDTTRNL